MIGMLGISCDGDVKEQREAILSILGQTESKEKIDIEKYIHKNLERESQFFIVEKGFWDSWSIVNDRFEPQHAPKTIIDNQKLILRGHDLRKDDNLIYNEDFIVLPKYAFKALSKWYPCNKVMELNVSKAHLYDSIMKISRISTQENVSNGEQRSSNMNAPQAQHPKQYATANDKDGETRPIDAGPSPLDA